MEGESERSMYCTFCSGVPSQMCLTCCSYICSDCVGGHRETCNAPDLHPAELVELLRQGEAGIACLNRGKTVDLAISHLRNMLERISERAHDEVDAAVTAAHNCIDQAKEMFTAKVREEVRKLSQTIDELDLRLSAIKYSEAPEATLEIEHLFFTQALSAIIPRLEEEVWIEITRNSDVFTHLQSSLVSVQVASPLLCERSSCAWVNRYALLIGNSTKMCDLASFELFNVSFSASWGNTVSSIQLSTGAYFLCGVRNGKCYLIDSNYSEMKFAGKLVVGRLGPGLAVRDNNIYIFGGLDCVNELPTRTIQVFNLQSKLGRTTATEMALERFCLSPCWCRGRILVAGGKCEEGIEEFDPDHETMRFIPVTIPRAGPTVCFPHGEGEIVILSCYQYVFNLDSEKLTAFSHDEEVFLCHFNPLLFHGKYYFTIFQHDNEMYKLAYMSEDSLKLHLTGIEFSLQ